MTRVRRQNRHFTLVELLIVIGIIIVLAGGVASWFRLTIPNVVIRDIHKFRGDLTWARELPVVKTAAGAINNYCQVSIDISNEWYGIYMPSGELVRQGTLQSDIQSISRVTSAGSEVSLGSAVSFRFNRPFGKISDTGGNIFADINKLRIALTYGGIARRITIYGNTGYVTYRE